MPTDKSFRKVQGLSSTPATKGAEYQVKVSRVPVPHETAAAPKGQARSPKPQHLGATRGVGAGGKRVPPMGTTKHTRAMGIEST
jgi:hypothetical protein